jgi:hypothetical protein
LIKKREIQRTPLEKKELTNKGESLESIKNESVQEILLETMVKNEKIEEQEEDNPVFEKEKDKQHEDEDEEEKEKEKEKDEEKEKEKEKDDVDLELDLEIEDLNKEEEKNNLKEFEFSLSNDNHLETISLKKPNEVYDEIYRKARKKAKELKKQAILAYLEARNIKKTYMLDDIENSDSDNESDFGEEFSL